MDQLQIGAFIAKKRKEKNLSQAALADKLGVSNKTVSKWETGKCMPDYSVIESLCKELEISVSELMDGEEAADKSIRTYDDTQILDLIKRTQNLENQKNMMWGIIVFIIGIVMVMFSKNIGGSSVKDFISGLMLGVGSAEMLVGIFVTASSLPKIK